VEGLAEQQGLQRLQLRRLPKRLLGRPALPALPALSELPEPLEVKLLLGQTGLPELLELLGLQQEQKVLQKPRRLSLGASLRAPPSALALRLPPSSSAVAVVAAVVGAALLSFAPRVSSPVSQQLYPSGLCPWRNWVLQVVLGKLLSL